MARIIDEDLQLLNAGADCACRVYTPVEPANSYLETSLEVTCYSGFFSLLHLTPHMGSRTVTKLTKLESKVR
jgi:hypothetical protein